MFVSSASRSLVSCARSVRVCLAKGTPVRQYATKPAASPTPMPSIPSYHQNITDYLVGDVTKVYEKPATIDYGTDEEIPYSSFKEKVDWMAIQYYIRGWEQGEMVAIFMPNQFLFNVSVLGAAKIGVPFTVVDPAATPFDLQHQLKNSKTIYIITTQELLPVVRQVTTSMRGLKEVLVLDKIPDPSDETEIRYTIEMKYNLLLGKPPGWGAIPDWEVRGEDTALVHYGPAIRGTKPPGEVISHSNLIASLYQLSAALPSINSSSVLLTMVPLFHLTAFAFNNLALVKGAKSIVLKSLTYENFVKAVVEHEVTAAHVTKEILDELVDKMPKLPSLKLLVYEGDATDSAAYNFEHSFPDVELRALYGAPAPALIGDTTALLPLAGTEAVVVNSSGVSVSGEEGELRVRGPQISAGHFLDEVSTKMTFASDSFRRSVGDKATRDGDGFSIKRKVVVPEE
eukprot:TRINITY_DN12742_c0_g1_i1.p1 TRINITY_DN12742_c0_g1~~TRINITY_DN12742_c0_g1_i1.p1  ORF type:complete len:464 (-),score=123.46 TRINITY_DN12742_c0_g1_i1:30-1397(-)